MKITKLMMAMVAMSAAVCFTSCSDDDDENEIVDVRTQAVGTYDVTTTVYISDDLVLEADEVVSSNKYQAEVVLGRDANSMVFAGELNLVKIAAASNGFTFDIEEQQVEGMHLKPVLGFTLGETKYCGGYLSASKSLTFYYEIPLEEAFGEEVTSDLLEALINLYGLAGDNAEAIESLDDLVETLDNAKVIFEFKCIKK